MPKASSLNESLQMLLLSAVWANFIGKIQKGLDMSLSHVLMRAGKHGYRPVTEAEADQKYPATVSADSGIFICEICSQPVTFTAGKVKVRHFRHSSKAENKDCEERTVQYGNALPIYGFQQALHTLPLRVVQVAGRYRLELGLLALSGEHLMQYSGHMLLIEGQHTKPFSYDIEERLLPDRLTWLDVGNVPAKSYQLSLSGGMRLPFRWPRQVDGMSDITLFDAETGKRLPPFPDVEVGREYIVAIHGRSNPWNMGDVSVKYLSPHEHGWKGWVLLSAKALRFTKLSARFFLQFQAILTKHTAPNIFPLWPAFVRTPHLIYYDAKELFIFIGGEDTTVHLFPATNVSEFKRGRARIIRFAPGRRKQMVTDACAGQLLEIGRSHMLRYDYFIRRELEQTAPRPIVMVTDQRGTMLQKDWIEGVPRGTAIRVLAPFNGEVWLENGGILSDQRELKGGEELELKVNPGQTLTIFQGLDRIRSIVFARPNQQGPEGGHNKESWYDAQLYRRLRRLTGDEISATHLLAEAVLFFRGYRATGAWLRARKAEGRISARALAQLRMLMEE